jgi:hypothetical protein
MALPHYTQILPNLPLYQGDAVGAATDAGKFDVIVVAAEELRPVEGLMVPPGVRVVDAGIDDAELTHREAWTAENAASLVAREIAQGHAVLVACFMGLNRSGLMVALALKRMGMTGEQAIAAVRKARPRALGNESFVRYLRT